MVITILTLFPEMFSGPFSHSIIKRAIDKKLIEIKIVNIRDFGIGKHKVVDDTPYGGGVGMILRPDVAVSALESLPTAKKQKRILLSANGQKFTQKMAKEFSKLNELIILCGHYEGIDVRVEDFVDKNISIGDFVLTGGEIPAMIIADAVSRLVEGVLKKDATENESFSKNLLEHGQYTKPLVFRKKKVPDVLISGNHKKIEEWKEKESNRITKIIRPDLL